MHHASQPLSANCMSNLWSPVASSDHCGSSCDIPQALLGLTGFVVHSASGNISNLGHTLVNTVFSSAIPLRSAQCTIAVTAIHILANLLNTSERRLITTVVVGKHGGVCTQPFVLQYLQQY